MASGTIKKLVSDKGFGFIQTGDGGTCFSITRRWRADNSIA